ncbi:hypothetical protein EON83_20975 [bacterium]|nr:MAG: hypothetical protein EON83_20975 [bacterium]
MNYRPPVAVVCHTCCIAANPSKSPTSNDIVNTLIHNVMALHSRFSTTSFSRFCLGAALLATNGAPLLAQTTPARSLSADFVSPPDTARPWVYWYFMDGNLSKEGIHNDLEEMKKAGIGGAIYLEVNIGVPRGPVQYMGPEWQQLFVYAVSEAKRLGIQIALGSGPGWNGSGGPWVTPELSMQNLVGSTTSVSGPTSFDAVLERPKPRAPYFGEGTLSPEMRTQWLDYYRDEVVIAFPTPTGNARISNVEQKADYYRAPYSSAPNVPPRLPMSAQYDSVPAEQTLSTAKMIDLTGKLDKEGRLKWDVPAGNWTIMRFGRTAAGNTTRPAPIPGLGFESDKFDRRGLDNHMASYADVLFKQLGPNYRQGDAGLTMLHFDSWEMSAQNWSENYRKEFIKRRGYDPLPLLPAMLGYVVDNTQRSERFLWDLRQTASELIVENHGMYMKEYAHKHGLNFSVEPYDMNPSADLDLGSTADLPMGEFWSRGHGLDSDYSCYEAVSIGHTNGRPVIGAEAFTSDGGDGWLQHPGSMKNQLDWALCNGINKFVIHRYQHQPQLGKFPGMTMGPYGVHWEHTQTWWDMVPAFHKYMARTGQLLRQGLPVSDILYLTPEGAPQIFTPPLSALSSGDHKGYSFDGCSPKTLIARASVKNGNIVLPDGTTYRVLVLPSVDTMTPELLSKISSLVKAGATIMGMPPVNSPSLSNYPNSDAQVKALATELWGKAPYAASRKVGKGKVFLTSVDKSTALKDAIWIWENAGANNSAPAGKRYFKTTLNIDQKSAIKTAIATMTADNSFELFINGHSAGSGDNFHLQTTLDIAQWLKPGENAITVTGTNDTDSPNPAGLIGSLDVSYADGTKQTLKTGKEWSASTTAAGPWDAAKELGQVAMGPWGLDITTTPIYPDYSLTANVLQSAGVAPDFSATAPMRFIHRNTREGQLYFVANSKENPIQTTATFRTTGFQPEWWDATTGTIRDLPDYTTSKGLTSIPLNLAPSESGFVMFRKKGTPRIRNVSNFPTYQTAQTLSRPWNVSFDSKWGGPANITFEKLDDWSKRSEPGIKYYSGKATYTTTFDVPAGKQPTAISLGTVKNIASVKLNGTGLGVVWCDPWRATIPTGVLKPTGNQLEITVANLWVNKLIEESGKPEAQRQTWTTYNPWNSNSTLQPSGLLGPVTLETATNTK